MSTLFEELGGLPTLQHVHRIFYDKIYAHPWLQLFFFGHDQTAIEHMQTAFMAQKMGGIVEYTGKDIKTAHAAMYIPAELFEARHALLDAALREAGVPHALRLRWLRIDNAFKKTVVNR